MSNTVPESVDVNTVDGFRAAIAAKLDGAEPVTPATPVPGVTPGTDQTPQPSAGEGEEYIDLAEDVLPVLEHYGGDVNAALRALTEAQSLIGRQGSELGELRKLQQAPEPQLGVITPDLTDQLETAFQGTDNPAALMYQIVSAYPNDDRLYRAAVKAWATIDPVDATEYNLLYLQERQRIQQGEGGDQTLVEIRQERNLMDAGLAAAEKYPDWEALEPVVENAYGRLDPSVQEMLADDDPGRRAAGIDILVQYARVDRAALVAAGGVSDDPELNAQRVAAMVATGSQSQVGAGGTPDEQSDRISKFKESTFGVPTTSIAAELARQGVNARS